MTNTRTTVTAEQVRSMGVSFDDPRGITDRAAGITTWAYEAWTANGRDTAALAGTGVNLTQLANCLAQATRVLTDHPTEIGMLNEMGQGGLHPAVPSITDPLDALDLQIESVAD